MHVAQRLELRGRHARELRHERAQLGEVLDLDEHAVLDERVLREVLAQLADAPRVPPVERRERAQRGELPRGASSPSAAAAAPGGRHTRRRAAARGAAPAAAAAAARASHPRCCAPRPRTRCLPRPRAENGLASAPHFEGVTAGSPKSAQAVGSETATSNLLLLLRIFPATPGSKMRQGETRRELVLEAVASDGLALRHASAALKDDRKVVLAAVQQNHRALSYASESLQNDREVVVAAVRQSFNVPHVPREQRASKSTARPRSRFGRRRSVASARRGGPPRRYAQIRARRPELRV